LWRSESKADGTVEEITETLDNTGTSNMSPTNASRADLHFKRGRRHALSLDFVSATVDFEKAEEIIAKVSERSERALMKTRIRRRALTSP